MHKALKQWISSISDDLIFKLTDPVRHIHAVQYVSPPDYDWKRLREEQNGKFEKEINPAPSPKEWFLCKRL